MKKDENLLVLCKIFVTGNTVIDAVAQHLPIDERRSKIMKYIRFKEYASTTARMA